MATQPQKKEKDPAGSTVDQLQVAAGNVWAYCDFLKELMISLRNRILKQATFLAYLRKVKFP